MAGSLINCLCCEYPTVCDKKLLVCIECWTCRVQNEGSKPNHGYLTEDIAYNVKTHIQKNYKLRLDKHALMSPVSPVFHTIVTVKSDINFI